ncbi:Ezrin/radixin/moesin family protein [Rapidithrix thailandica]|uniref:Ezrin/radixin/moesin family protein n=1 Tax=Rapidithrix thailandica TaxID=413964 RepID=A0AAW9S802_9BACT
MKHALLAILLIWGMGILAVVDVSAQSKAERKAKKKEMKKWKRKLKGVDPIKFKEMTEDYNMLKGEVAGLKSQVGKLQKEAQDATSQLGSKNEQISSLEQKLKDLQEDCDNNVSNTGDDYTKGVVYKVQIGAFRNKDLSQFQEKGNFWTEDEDGLKKYTIGYFRDYWEADTFKKYLREMGVKDAWIVAYDNNERKDIKEVLEMSSTQEN